MATSFSMQALGFFTGSIVSIAILAIFKKAINNNIDNLDYVWRVCIGIGAIPACSLIYFRCIIHEKIRKTETNSTQRSNTTLKEFLTYFAKWKNFKLLLATTVCWFIFDASFFGINLNAGIIIEAMGFSGNLQDGIWNSLFKNSIGILIVTLLGLIPGYW